MSTIDFPFDKVDAVTFAPKPQPLPASLRPIYRIALIVLVLKINCRSHTASLLKLQFFNWLLKSASLQELLEKGLAHQGVFTLELIHIDPMVNLSLNYAFSDKLIGITNNSKYKLTEKGHRFAKLFLQDDQSVLAGERELLTRIGQQVSEVWLRNEML
jgi:hypothetical protein